MGLKTPKTDFLVMRLIYKEPIDFQLMAQNHNPYVVISEISKEDPVFSPNKLSNLIGLFSQTLKRWWTKLQEQGYLNITECSSCIY